eukprot:COSAG03_NODE_9062_length_748_cov_8.061633_2_plen_52_part_01
MVQWWMAAPVFLLSLSLVATLPRGSRAPAIIRLSPTGPYLTLSLSLSLSLSL